MCQECNNTGWILTQGIMLSRPYYEKNINMVVQDYHGDGQYKKTQCPCVGEGPCGCTGEIN